MENEDRIAILMIGRPYHLDPGLNHSIPEEFQLLGYPVLSIRSVPKDEAWLSRYFEEDLVDPPVTVSKDGTIAVPRGPGLGHEIVAERVDRATEALEEFKR